MTLSRTGYTGDLGYEITVVAGDALDVLDTVLEAGKGHGIRPFGEEALMLLRIEAGLLLIDVEWRNSRTAWTDAERVTPKELGMGWMLRGLDDDTRPFVRRDAIRRQLAGQTSRWSTVGLVVDFATPIAAYYQCGSGTHPGGCVIGSPGRLASQRVLRDLPDPVRR